MAMNTPIQGSAADLIKIAMVRVHEELVKRKLRSKLILQVHDELIIETHRSELQEVKQLVEECMEKAIELSVPVVADISSGDNWYNSK
jgi:DNA polymerase-1